MGVVWNDIIDDPKPEFGQAVVYGTFVKQGVQWDTSNFGSRWQQLQTEDGRRVDIKVPLASYAPSEDDGPQQQSKLAKLFDKGPGQRVALTLAFKDAAQKTAEVVDVQDLGRDENPLRGRNSFAFEPHIRATAPREVTFK